jgi:hypothetical protein
MSSEEREVGVVEAVNHGMRVEAEHLDGWFNEFDFGNGHDPWLALCARVDAYLYSQVAASMGAARRYLAAHPGEGNEKDRRFVSKAHVIARSLPPHLRRLWEMHYMDGRPLDEYSVSTGVDPDRAAADYQETIQAIVTIVNASSAQWQEEERALRMAS